MISDTPLLAGPAGVRLSGKGWQGLVTASVSQNGEARCLVVTQSRVRSPPMAGTPRTAPEHRGGSTGRDGRADPATEAFLVHRNLLFTVAYEMLGSAADAEDVLQETWLRWAG